MFSKSKFFTHVQTFHLPCGRFFSNAMIQSRHILLSGVYSHLQSAMFCCEVADHIHDLEKVPSSRLMTCVPRFLIHMASRIHLVCLFESLSMIFAPPNQLCGFAERHTDWIQIQWQQTLYVIADSRSIFFSFFFFFFFFCGKKKKRI